MTMLTLSKWGNAQAVRLPKAMREQVGMPDDSQIEATVENGAIVLKPARSAKRAIRVANLASVFKDRKGHEQRKRRPVVVVSNDAFNRNCTLTVVAAISHGRGDFELHIPFSPVPASDVSNGGSGVADGFVQLEQIRALDLSARNAVKIGSLRQKDMDTVTSMLLGCFIQPDMMVLPSY